MKPLKKWKAPLPKFFHVNDNGSEVHVVVTYRIGSVPSKVRYALDGRNVKIPTEKMVTAKDGTTKLKTVQVPLTMPLPVRETVIQVELPDGTAVSARSVCKPGDTFSERAAVRIAAKRLVRDSRIPKTLRQPLMEALCPGFFKKPIAKKVEAVETSPQAS